MEYKLTEDWKDVKNLVIYGFGKVAHDNLQFFKNNFSIVCIVDSDKEKSGIVYKGIKVKHISEAKEELRGYKIVIMTANRNAALVGEDLKKLGLHDGKDFCSMEQFLTEWFWSYKKKVCLMEVHSTITSRCTLRCKHCNMFMPYYKEHVDYLYEYCIKCKKEVYFISDMYYTLQDIKYILDKCGVTIPDDEHIWISCEKKCDKVSGSIWKEYSELVGKDIKCLHIGDNKTGDVENPAKYGIDSYYVMSAKDMFMNSSISELASNVNTVSDSICLGLVVAKLFNSPFALCSTNGKVSFEDSEIYGYCVYGPLLEKFLIWLYYNSRKDGIEKLLFFARDGYFLEKDYKVVSELLNDGYEQDWCYLPISRRCIYMATMENEDDFKRVVAFPYVGTFAEYMKSRFGIIVTEVTSEYNNRQINVVGDSKDILEWIQLYKDEIIKKAKRERENYLRYLKTDGDMQKGLTYGTVDLGYYGTNQYYLQRLTGIKTKGYCFYACLGKDNVYISDISMTSCFQYGDDYTAEKSIVRKKNMYIETFITAPHGMISYIDNQGKMICKPDGKSQEYFDIKEKVNCGAVDFIVNYINIYKVVLAVNSKEHKKLMQDRRESLEDNLFYNILNGICNVSNDILEGFYFDNDFVGGKEIKLEI